MDASGNVTAVNTFGPTGLLSRHTSTGGSTFYAFDPQGNVSVRMDGSGNVLGTYTFDAFGARVGTDSTTDPFSGFGGQWGYYSDPETGLQLLTHRYYDSGAGRFVTRDPISYNGGVNLYNYTANNPVNGSDPSGLSQNPNAPAGSVGISAAVYIPDRQFSYGGVTWFGDNRGTSANSSRYRVQLNLWFDPASGAVSHIIETTGESRVLEPVTGWLLQGKPNPQLEVASMSTPCGDTYTYITAQASDGLADVGSIHLAPTAGIKILIYRLHNGKVFAEIENKDYPATEAYSYDSSGSHQLLNLSPMPGTTPGSLINHPGSETCLG